MRLPDVCLAIGLAVLGPSACDELGNPEQLTTGPTVLEYGGHELVTTTHSFRNPKTIRRIVEDEPTRFVYSDASIGPEQTLTVVTVAPRRLRPVRPGRMTLTTRFEFPGGTVVERRWQSVEGSRLWEAAFALPDPPTAAATTAAP